MVTKLFESVISMFIDLLASDDEDHENNQFDLDLQAALSASMQDTAE